MPVIDYVFRAAQSCEVAEIFGLYVERVRWMDENNINQWNTTGYLERYPVSYYKEQCELGTLYILLNANDSKLVGAVVLYQSDDRWLDKADVPAYYIHNLVTAPGVKGAGVRIIEESERLGIEHGKHCMRLDCAEDNIYLNEYYASKGYVEAGRCKDGLYVGIRREKRLPVIISRL